MYQSLSGGHVQSSVAHSWDSMSSSAVGTGYTGYDGTSDSCDVPLKLGEQRCSFLSG